MIVKPAIQWINADSDALFLNDSGVVLKAMADNVAIYDKPSPPLADIQLALDNFSAGIAAMVNGGQPATINKNNLRLIAANLMRQLAAYVTVAFKGSMVNLILSGFPPQKPVRTPVGPLPQPQGLTVSHGAQLDQLVVSVNPVFGAANYNYRLTPNTPGATPIIEQDTASNHTFSSLVAGVNYKLEVSALGTAGQSDWSNPASLTAD
jgi:hypothetical protein